MALSDSQIDELRKVVKGDVLLPKDEEYQKSITSVWNEMHHQKKPLVIVQPRGARDVANCIHFASKHSIPLTAKGGGHNTSGRALLDGGMVIDLNKYMRQVRVDAEKKTVYAQGGCIWADVDYECSPHGLAVVGGVVSETGVGGLTLGGGWGYLTKQYGLTCDNLISADVVLADGTQVTCSSTSHEDLFWAIRGGGANFGIVTAFLFQAHDISPVVYGGLLLFDYARTKEILETYKSIYKSLPNKAVIFPLIIVHPENPQERALAMLCFYDGKSTDAEKAFKPILDLGPVANMCKETPFEIAQKFVDSFAPKPCRSYWKAGFIKEITPEILDLARERMKSYPSPVGGIMFENYFNENWNQLSSDRTAFSHRRNQFCLLLNCMWTDAKSDQDCVAWVKETYALFEKYFVGSYLNFSPDDGDKVFDTNKQKLLEIKRKYDPSNMFCHTNNNLVA